MGGNWTPESQTTDCCYSWCFLSSVLTYSTLASAKPSFMKTASQLMFAGYR